MEQTLGSLPKLSGKDQDAKTWFEGYARYCEANGWDENKRYEMVSSYFDGEINDWFENNKDLIHDLKQIEVILTATYEQVHQPGLNETKVEYQEQHDSFSGTVVFPVLEFPEDEGITAEDVKTYSRLRLLFITNPANLVYKIKQTPPSSDISDAFFKSCVVAACTKRDVLMKYISNTFGNSTLLEEYINTNFAMKGKLNFNNMNLIGNLLLCYVPNTFSDFITSFRQKLQAQSIFDSDIDNSELSPMQKKIIKEKLNVFDRENAKICGYIMHNFMTRCAKGMPLPDISFLHTQTTTLTTVEAKSLDMDA